MKIMHWFGKGLRGAPWSVGTGSPLSKAPTLSGALQSRCAAVLLLASSSAIAEPADILVDPAYVRNIGGITEFSRDQFITVHEAFGSVDMDEDDLRYLEEVLEARYGRDGGFISWMAGQVPADPNNPDMPDIEVMKEKVAEFREEYAGRRLTPENMKAVIWCTHPDLMHAMSDNTYTAWGPRTYDAVAEFTAQLLKEGFSDAERPQFLEVFNEPFVKARKMGTTVEAMSEQHNVVAKRVKELTPDVMVGGYSAAWVEVESDNFGHWDRWQKTFMDLAGENMDFWSYHIYDGVNVTGSPRERTGSNSEAIMDLVDTYSHMKFGVAKPIMITEYGQIPGGNMNSMPYSAERSAGMLYSAMGQLMTYMDHPDRLLRVIPFFLGKATWTYGMKNEHVPGEANPYLLWRMQADGSFVETDLSLFYQFFKGVEGEWRLSKTSNPDVRVHLLADGKRLNVLMMNIDTSEKEIRLAGLSDLKTESIALRTLTTNGKKPVLGQRVTDKVPATLELDRGEAVLLMIDLEEEVALKGTVQEHRVYATDYLKDIKAGHPIHFMFEDVPVGEGTAVLRLSPGRELGKQVLPSSVTFNGKGLALPDNWMGDDQAGRKNFFGAIEIPVPMECVKKTSSIEIIYPDNGGKVACAVLQVNRKEVK
ncbi:hypothetical protein P4B35_00780 [Pontiellaceae bacterium B12227]|nr:hypothetical protein [Pontiellaceae bacterium B12227]